MRARTPFAFEAAMILAGRRQYGMAGGGANALRGYLNIQGRRFSSLLTLKAAIRCRRSQADLHDYSARHADERCWPIEFNYGYHPSFFAYSMIFTACRRKRTPAFMITGLRGRDFYDATGR